MHFYDAPTARRTLGSAVALIDPPLQGTILIKVGDVASQGARKLYAVTCDDAEHAANLSIPGLRELDEAEAVALAARYHPAQTHRRRDPFTGKEDTEQLPACDLRALLPEA
jgi:hypothetical protein